MTHCFCCDSLLDNPTLDRPTGRYYCQECFEPTNEVILKMSNEDYRTRVESETFSEKFISLEELLELETNHEQIELESIDSESY